MPGGDRTGPEGIGPMTGRAAGYCAGNNAPGHMNTYGGGGRGFRRNLGGRGSGFGRRGGFSILANPAVQAAIQTGAAPVSANDTMELEELRNQSKAIEASLSEVQKRIEILENQATDKAEGSETPE